MKTNLQKGKLLNDDGTINYEAVEDKKKIKNNFTRRSLARLQVELMKLQEWIKHERLKVVIIFEGRDAAGREV